MTDFLASVWIFVLVVGYTLGPFFGLYAAVASGSFFHALFSIAVPWYGIIYWFVS